MRRSLFRRRRTATMVDLAPPASSAPNADTARSTTGEPRSLNTASDRDLHSLFDDEPLPEGWIALSSDPPSSSSDGEASASGAAWAADDAEMAPTTRAQEAERMAVEAALAGDMHADEMHRASEALAEQIRRAVERQVREVNKADAGRGQAVGEAGAGGGGVGAGVDAERGVCGGGDDAFPDPFGGTPPGSYGGGIVKEHACPPPERLVENGAAKLLPPTSAPTLVEARNKAPASSPFAGKAAPKLPPPPMFEPLPVNHFVAATTKVAPPPPPSPPAVAALKASAILAFGASVNSSEKVPAASAPATAERNVVSAPILAKTVPLAPPITPPSPPLIAAEPVPVSTVSVRHPKSISLAVEEPRVAAATVAAATVAAATVAAATVAAAAAPSSPKLDREKASGQTEQHLALPVGLLSSQIKVRELSSSGMPTQPGSSPAPRGANNAPTPPMQKPPVPPSAQRPTVPISGKFAPSRSGASLPPGWVLMSEGDDARGTPYYYHAQTGESRWEKPRGTDDLSAVGDSVSVVIRSRGGGNGTSEGASTYRPLPKGWVLVPASPASMNREYYYHANLGRSLWVRPTVGSESASGGSVDGAPLPEGWVVVRGVVAAGGRNYYYNKSLGKSMWTRPGGGPRRSSVPSVHSEISALEMKQAVTGLPDGWAHVRGTKRSKGRDFYYNKARNESRWTRPTGSPADEKSGGADIVRDHNLPTGWMFVKGSKRSGGRAYFYNAILNKSSWTRPGVKDQDSTMEQTAFGDEESVTNQANIAFSKPTSVNRLFAVKDDEPKQLPKSAVTSSLPASTSGGKHPDALVQDDSCDKDWWQRGGGFQNSEKLVLPSIIAQKTSSGWTCSGMELEASSSKEPQGLNQSGSFLNRHGQAERAAPLMFRPVKARALVFAGSEKIVDDDAQPSVPVKDPFNGISQDVVYDSFAVRPEKQEQLELPRAVRGEVSVQSPASPTHVSMLEPTSSNRTCALETPALRGNCQLTVPHVLSSDEGHLDNPEDDGRSDTLDLPETISPGDAIFSDQALPPQANSLYDVLGSPSSSSLKFRAVGHLGLSTMESEDGLESDLSAVLPPIVSNEPTNPSSGSLGGTSPVLSSSSGGELPSPVDLSALHAGKLKGVPFTEMEVREKNDEGFREDESKELSASATKDSARLEPQSARDQPSSGGSFIFAPPLVNNALGDSAHSQGHTCDAGPIVSPPVSSLFAPPQPNSQCLGDRPKPSLQSLQVSTPLRNARSPAESPILTPHRSPAISPIRLNDPLSSPNLNSQILPALSLQRRKSGLQDPTPSNDDSQYSLYSANDSGAFFSSYGGSSAMLGGDMANAPAEDSGVFVSAYGGSSAMLDKVASVPSSHEEGGLRRFVPMGEGASSGGSGAGSRSSKGSDGACTLPSVGDDYLPKTADSRGALPPGWVTMIAFSLGKRYYYNAGKNLSVWERPDAKSDAALPVLPNPSQELDKSEDGGGEWQGATTMAIADGHGVNGKAVRAHATVSTSVLFEKHEADCPAAVELESPLPNVGALPVGWIALWAQNNRIYFYNAELGVTGWDRPA